MFRNAKEMKKLKSLVLQIPQGGNNSVFICSKTVRSFPR